MDTESDQASIVTKAADLLLAMKKNGADPENLQRDAVSLRKERLLVQAQESEMNDPLQDVMYELIGSLATAADWMAKREFIRKEQKGMPADKNKSGFLNTGNEEDDDLSEDDDNDDKEDSDTESEESSVSGRKDNANPTKIRKAGKVSCDICGGSFASNRNLRVHKRLHLSDENGRKPFECEHCGRRFAQDTTLKGHLRVHLPSDDPRRKQSERSECEVCFKSFLSKSALHVHKKSHLEDEEARLPYKCHHCDRRFVNSAGRERHMNTHFDFDDPRRVKLECEICGKMFYGSNALREHQKTHLDENDPEQAKVMRPHTCEVCGKPFRNAANLRNHMRGIHARQPRKKPYGCTDCGGHFSRPGELRDHQKTHLPDDDPNKWTYNCDVCQKPFMDHYLLKVHLTTHLDENNPEEAAIKRQFECDECGQTFRNATNLRNHMNIHTGNYRFKCHLCHYGFNSQYLLTKHLASHENGTFRLLANPNVRNKKCTLCPKKFKKKGELAAHLKRHEDGTVGDSTDEEEEEVIIFKCPVCGEKYKYRCSLKLHLMKKHGGIELSSECFVRSVKTDDVKQSHEHDIDPKVSALTRPHKCDVCGRAFRTAGQLKTHMNVHTGNYPFKCNLCPLGFNAQPVLTRHLECHEKGTNKISRADPNRRTKKCTICQKNFKKMGELTAHLKRHQDGTIGDSTDDEGEPEVIQCEICGNKYAHRSTLKTHIKDKHGELHLPSDKHEQRKQVRTEAKPGTDTEDDEEES